MQFLVGHCWRGQFEKTKELDTHCFESVFDGQHIRDKHRVTGGSSVYSGESIYSWNGDLKRVEYSYWNSVGGISHGTMVPKPGILDFGEDSYTAPDGRRISFVTYWRKVDDTTYEMVTTSKASTGGEKVVRFSRVD
jgi:hypothetical protein